MKRKKVTTIVEETTTDKVVKNEETTIPAERTTANPDAFSAPAEEADTFTEPVLLNPDLSPTNSAPAEPVYAKSLDDFDDMFSTYGLKPSELQDEADDLFNPNDYQPKNGNPVVLKRRPGYTDPPFNTTEPRQNTPAIVTQNGVANVTSEKSFWQKWGALIVGLAAVLFFIGVAAFFVNLGSHKTAPKETTAATTVAETTASETAAAETTVPAPTAIPVVIVTPGTWLMVEGTYENNRWFPQGVREIGEAKTDQEAFDAANVWLERVKTDPNLLVGAVKIFLDQDITKEELVNVEGWATDKAVQLVAEMQLIFAQAKITPSQAPADGYNSGVNDSTVVVAANPGISGDTTAIQVETDDGKDVWIMERCGNYVTPSKPDVPTGKTDETPTPTPTPQPTPTPTPAPTPTPTPQPTPTPTPAPTPTPTLTPKDPAKDPAVQSNAPVGSGVNQDPGPGAYIAPTDMVTPPAESRINPTPPTETITPTTVVIIIVVNPTTTTTQAPPVATPTPTRTPVVPNEPAASGTPVVPD